MKAYNLRIDVTDKGTCSPKCDYKSDKLCCLFGVELVGPTNQDTTRCGQCYQMTQSNLIIINQE